MYLVINNACLEKKFVVKIQEFVRNIAGKLVRINKTMNQSLFAVES